jgi:DNA-binding FadR family transcriptional regulator
MCTVRTETEIMVCDVSRDAVREALTELLGKGFEAETVHGEGTRFTCLDGEKAPLFHQALRQGQERAAKAAPSEVG